MHFSTVDYVIIVVYLIGVAVFGILFSGRQKTANDYFLGSQKMSWWSVCFSIVATETSTLTFISIPGLAYISNMNFLQLAIGYILGRIVIAFVLIPKYYKGEIKTAYEFLGIRFGEPMRKYASITFIILAILANGVRLFITAIPIKFITGLGYFECILIISVVTFIYSYIGGIKAIIWTDVIQLFIYILGAVASIIIIYNMIPGGWNDIVSYAAPKNKFEIFNFNFDSFKNFFTGPYNVLGGIIGGAFLSMASHGTDQTMVQRLLTCSNKKDAQKAIIGSGLIVFIQFSIFLILGVMIFALYQGADYHTLKIADYSLLKSDEIFPKFIIESLPVGLAGLVVAGLLAASMSTLSSAFNSLSLTTVKDLFKIKNTEKNPNRELQASRFATVFWGIVIVGSGLLFRDEKNPAVDYALKIQSLIYGGLLGVFLLGVIMKKANLRDAMIAYTITIIVLACLFILPQFGVMPALNLTWFTFFGVIITFITAGFTVSVFPGKGKAVDI
ncbi:sodium:solute symporter [soil metagenome]